MSGVLSTHSRQMKELAKTTKAAFYSDPLRGVYYVVATLGLVATAIWALRGFADDAMRVAGAAAPPLVSVLVAVPGAIRGIRALRGRFYGRVAFAFEMGFLTFLMLFNSLLVPLETTKVMLDVQQRHIEVTRGTVELLGTLTDAMSKPEMSDESRARLRDISERLHPKQAADDSSRVVARDLRIRSMTSLSALLILPCALVLQVLALAGKELPPATGVAEPSRVRMPDGDAKFAETGSTTGHAG